MKEDEDFLLKKGTSKGSQGFGPYQNKPFKNSGRRPSGRLPCLNHSWRRKARTSLLKRHLKDSQGFGPYQNKPFHAPHKKRTSYMKRPYGGNSSQSSNQLFFFQQRKTELQRLHGSFFRPHNRGRGRGSLFPMTPLKPQAVHQ